MKSIGKVVAWIILVMAAALILLGIMSWPPGGLMFALPYFFLLPGVLLGLIGGLLLWVVNKSSNPKDGRTIQRQ